MSYDWTTLLYFERHAECSRDFLIKIADACEMAGFTIVVDDQGRSNRSASEKDGRSVSGWATALATAVHDGKASWDVHHERLDISALLAIVPSGSAALYKDSAAAAYGYVGLSIYADKLCDDKNELLYDGMMAVFRVSQLLAQAADALYGVGDLIVRQVGGPMVFGTELTERRVPHLGWWNYFSNEYLKVLHVERLLTVSWWANYRTYGGTTFITRPPTGPLYATREEVSKRLS